VNREKVLQLLLRAADVGYDQGRTGQPHSGLEREVKNRLGYELELPTSKVPSVVDLGDLVHEGEVIIRLTNGWTLRSGGESRASGEYVRLCTPHGGEHLYWSSDEWRQDPVVVMGAIINAAAGYDAESGGRLPADPLAGRLAEDEINFRRALSLIREFIPSATEATFSTSDQGHYGFTFTSHNGPPIDDEAELDDALWPLLCNLKWDGVVGDGHSGHATWNLATGEKIAGW
jgi:hypothetical protein